MRKITMTCTCDICGKNISELHGQIMSKKITLTDEFGNTTPASNLPPTEPWSFDCNEICFDCADEFCKTFSRIRNEAKGK